MSSADISFFGHFSRQTWLVANMCSPYEGSQQIGVETGLSRAIPPHGPFPAGASLTPTVASPTA
jgi:hypothetical protein